MLQAVSTARLLYIGPGLLLGQRYRRRWTNVVLMLAQRRRNVLCLLCNSRLNVDIGLILGQHRRRWTHIKPVSKELLGSTDSKGTTIRFPGGGGGAGVFVAGKLFISTGLGGALKISHFVTCLYGTVLEVNYLFHAEFARNYLFQKYSCPPSPWESNGGP